jgi:ABC-type branched-subunit amino acid transport system substrate-binding protein
LNNTVFFRTVPSEAASGKKLAEYAIKDGLKKVVIFFNQDSNYSSTLKDKFQRSFKQQNGQVVKNQNLDTDEAIPISKSQAQAAVLFPDTAHIRQALQIAKLTMNPQNYQQQGLKLLGGDTLYNDDTLNQGKKAVEGLVLAVPWFRDAPQSKNFAEAAQQQWGAPISWRTATSYDATQAFIQAIKSVSNNLSRETVLTELQKVDLSHDKTSGEPLKFNSDRERQSKPVLVQVKDGKFTIVPQINYSK